MKRSDMILKLMETLIEAPEDLEEAAEYILKHLEKNGMQPPIWVSKLMPGTGMTLRGVGWENEDE